MGREEALPFISLSYIKRLLSECRHTAHDINHHFYSLTQSVVTMETILSSVSSGRVNLSDSISKVVCKPFRQVSQTPLRVTHTEHRRIHVCFLSSFSCYQVCMTDSLGLLAQILETDHFAVVAQEPPQSIFSITFAA